MFWTIAQYVFIAIVFIVAVRYVFKMVKTSWSKKEGSCTKGCGCENDLKENQSK